MNPLQLLRETASIMRTFAEDFERLAEEGEDITFAEFVKRLEALSAEMEMVTQTFFSPERS